MKYKGLNKDKLFFTSDEHYGHNNVIRYCSRPFQSVDQMNDVIISNFNAIVPKDGTTIHAGDFYLGPLKADFVHQRIISRLNGSHIFIMGSHDKWMKGPNAPDIIELNIDGQCIIISHYCMRTWAKSHYNSWHLYGHSHGTLEPIGKSWDIGVDNNSFYPLSFQAIECIMNDRPDNPNLIPQEKRRY